MSAFISSTLIQCFLQNPSLLYGLIACSVPPFRHFAFIILFQFLPLTYRGFIWIELFSFLTFFAPNNFLFHCFQPFSCFVTIIFFTVYYHTSLYMYFIRSLHFLHFSFFLSIDFIIFSFLFYQLIYLFSLLLTFFFLFHLSVIFFFKEYNFLYNEDTLSSPSELSSLKNLFSFYIISFSLFTNLPQSLFSIQKWLYINFPTYSHALSFASPNTTLRSIT